MSSPNQNPLPGSPTAPPADEPKPDVTPDASATSTEQEPSADELARAREKRLTGKLRAFERKAGAFSKGRTVTLLAIGETGQDYLRERLTGETDLGAIRTSRGAGVRRLQNALDEHCGGRGDTPRVEECLRLWGVAEVYGVDGAKALGIGQLRPFESTVSRSMDAGQTWTIDGTLTAEQQTGLRTLWSELTAGEKTLSAADTLASVQRLLGKEPTAKATRKADGQKQTSESKPDDGKGEGSKETPPAPEVVPESPVECAKRIATLLYGNPAVELVLRQLGQCHNWTDAQARALVQGMADAGKLQAVKACAVAAAEIARKLASNGNGGLQSKAS
jgi:hypothetical protein